MAGSPPGGAGTDAVRVAAEMRQQEPLLGMKPRTTHEDPEFMSTFFKASRLHFIGMWRARYQQLLNTLPEPPPLPASPSGRPRLIFHLDMDCFFAAVAMRGRPELQSKPVCVCWSNSNEGAGEISSANYPARAFGIRAGMFIREAKRLCPELVSVPYEFDKYAQTAEAMYRALFDASPHVQGVSVDEAYADMTGIPGSPQELAAALRRTIRERTGCPCSIGSGPNRLVARIATKHAKPDGHFDISQTEAQTHIASLPAADLPGVGRHTVQKLEALHVSTCAELQALSMQRLQREFGDKTGVMLYEFCRGVDRRKWEARPMRKSVGAQITWGVRFEQVEEANRFIADLAKEVSTRMRMLKVKGRSIALKVLRAVKNAPELARKGSVGHGICDHYTRTVTLPTFTDDPAVITREACAILRDLQVEPDQIRGAGIQVTRLDTDPASKAVTGKLPSRIAKAGDATVYDPSKPHPWAAYVEAASPAAPSSGAKRARGAPISPSTSTPFSLPAEAPAPARITPLHTRSHDRSPPSLEHPRVRPQQSDLHQHFAGRERRGTVEEHTPAPKRLRFNDADSQGAAAAGSPPAGLLPSVEEVAQLWFDHADGGVGLSEAPLTAPVARTLHERCACFAARFASVVGATCTPGAPAGASSAEVGASRGSSTETAEELGAALFAEVLELLLGPWRNAVAALRLLRFVGNLGLAWEALAERLRAPRHPAAGWRALCADVEAAIGEQLLECASTDWSAL